MSVSAYRDAVTDDETAAKSLAELAMVTDAQLVAEIRTAFAAVRDAWHNFRAGPEYPNRESPLRARAADHEPAVAQALTALAGVADGDLYGAEKAVGPVLTAYWSESTPAQRLVSEAVERLRIAAKQRPGLVRDARTLARRTDGHPI
jgi:hypothetical protein